MILKRQPQIYYIYFAELFSAAYGWRSYLFSNNPVTCYTSSLLAEKKYIGGRKVSLNYMRQSKYKMLWVFLRQVVGFISFIDISTN